MSLFILRFPPETLYDVDDLAMSAAMDLDVDDAMINQEKVGRQAGSQTDGRLRRQGASHAAGGRPRLTFCYYSCLPACLTVTVWW